MNNGTPRGGVVFTADRNGKEAGAVLLNGRDAYVEVPNSPSLSSPLGQGTISAWFRIDDWYVNDFGKYFFFCEKTESRFNYQYTTAITEEVLDPAEPSFFITSYTTDEAFSAKVESPEISLGEWVCATVTWNDEATVDFYVGDTKIGHSSNNLNVRPNNGNVEIGRSTGGELEFSQGAVDELRIYNRALNQEEIAEVCKENTTAVTRLDVERTLEVFPNPATGHFTIITQESEILSLDVYALTGQVIPVELTPTVGGFEVTLDYRGVVILRVRTTQGIRSVRVVIR